MKRGRPRQFDETNAIENAMLLFWKKGFEATTIDDLTKALGINRPSLYSTFGNKDQIFKLALDHYRSGPAYYVNRALAESTPIAAFSSLMSGLIGILTDKKYPGGCMFVCSAMPGPTRAGRSKNELSKRRLNGEKDIAKRFREFHHAGLIDDEPGPDALAKYAATMIWGISMQGANGATRSELVQLADLATENFSLILTKGRLGLPSSK
jgi:AcrR family transcriptional regulator